MRAICFIQEVKGGDLTMRQQILICRKALRKLRWPCVQELYAQAGTEEQPLTLRPGMADLLRAAAAEGADRLVVRVSYFSTDRAGVEQMVRDVQEEKDGGRDAGILAAPWQVSFYPDTDEPGIVEILLK